VLIDLATGVAAGGLPLCAAGERATSLALWDGAPGPIAYVGLWHAPEVATAEASSGRGRLLAIDARSGATPASARFDGALDALVLAAGPGGSSRLYAVEDRSESDEETSALQRGDRYDAHGWRLWALDPTTLEPLDGLRLAYPPVGLAVAPEGDEAYALVGPVDGRQARALMRLDLDTGAQTRLGRVPGTYGSSLVVTPDRVYVPIPEGRDVWVGDRQGRPLTTLAVGEHPQDVAFSGPP
jgi:hypothetical protein